MTEEEARTTMTRVASLAASAVNVAIGGMCPGFDLDPEMVEDLLAEALQISLEEFDGPIDGNDGRAELLQAIRKFRGVDEACATADRCPDTDDIFGGDP